MLFKRFVIAAGAVGAVTLGAMAGCSSPLPAGGLGGSCLANNTCNGTLVCQNNICIDASEAGTPDTGVKDTGVKDTGVKDNAVVDAGAMCPQPGDVSSFMPPSFKPPITPGAICTSMQVQKYYDDCFGQNGSANACQADIMAFGACAKCLESDGSMDANWGATVDLGPAANPNIPGCVALLGQTGCATELEKAMQCENAACEDQCWTNSAMMDQDFSDYLKCLNNAASSACKTYEQSATAACSGDAATALTQCKNMVGNDFTTGYNAFAVMICEGGG